MHIGISGTTLAFITLSNCWVIKNIKYLKPLSFTFTLAIATLAAYDLSTYFIKGGYTVLGNIFELLGDIEIFIATYVVFFISLNFINMFIKAINPKLAEELEEEEVIKGCICPDDDNNAI